MKTACAARSASRAVSASNGECRLRIHCIAPSTRAGCGTHDQYTANHWLANQDRYRDAVLRVLGTTYGADQAALWRQRWRMFWMACAELFGFRNGSEWLVAHYLFGKR